MRMKKYIAGILVFAMVVGVFAPLAGGVRAYGADKKLTEVKQTLTEGDRNNYPALRDWSPELGSTTLFWPVDVDDVEFVFSYHQKNVDIALKILRDKGGDAVITYDIYTRTSGSANTFRVYSANSGVYLPYKDFMDKNKDDKSILVNPFEDKNNPSFTVSYSAQGKDDVGLSFEFYGETVHFLWAKDGFYITVGNLELGRIYEFTLESKKDGESNLTASPVVKVCTGIAPDSFVSIPIANAARVSGASVVPSIMSDIYSGNTVSDSKWRSADVMDTWLVDSSKYGLNMTKKGTQDDPPGSDTNGISLRFDLPKEYVGGTVKDFADKMKPGTVGKTTVTLQFTHPVTKTVVKEETISVIISNITDVKKVTSQSDLADNLKLVTAPGLICDYLDFVGDEKDGRIEIRLWGLEPGLIFKDPTIIMSSEKIDIPQTFFSNTSVYTFLKYTVYDQGDRNYASITPYAGVSGYYMVRSFTPLENSNEDGKYTIPGSKQDLYTVFYDGKSGTIPPILLPAYRAGINVGFQVLFLPGTNTFKTESDKDRALHSQGVIYQIPDVEPGIGFPNNFSVFDCQQKQIAGYPDGDACAVELSMQWDIGDKAKIDKLIENNNGEITLVYDLEKSLTPNEAGASLSMFGKVELAIKRASGSALAVDYTFIPESNGGRTSSAFIIDGSCIIGERGSGSTATYYVAMKIDAKAILDPDITGNSSPSGIYADFVYPNIYFLRVTPDAVNGAESQIGASLWESITLNDQSKLTVPPPQNLKATAPKDPSVEELRATFDVSFDVPDRQLRAFFDSIDRSLYDDLQINLYISQNESLIRDFMKLDWPGRLSHAGIVPVSMSGITEKTLNFSGSGAKYVLEVSGAYKSSYADPRAALRSGKILKLTDIGLTASQKEAIINGTPAASVGTLAYSLIGLDKNQQYYICADIVATRNDTTISTPDIASAMSALAGVITVGDPSEPGANEQVPPTPENVKAELNPPGQSSATVSWKRVTASPSEKIEYEIIRLTGEQMSATMLESRLKFEDFYKTLTGDSTLASVEKVCVKTVEGEKQPLVYQNGSWVKASNTQSYEYDDSTDTLKFTDNTLSPNQIYFYYVRVLKSAESAESVRSTWGHASVTTNPVANPKNLKVEQDTTNLNRKTQAFISFDAPVSDLDKLGSAYTLQYQLKEDGAADWSAPVTMPPATLRANNPTPATESGYYHFTYLISGLKAGTSYSVRVRMLDASGNASLYSNSAQFRTDPDTEYDDKENKINEWMDYLNTELMKLLKQSYWLAADNTSALTAVYRPTMFGSVIAQSTDSMIKPVTNAETGSTTYYLPTSAVLEANNAGKGLMIAHDGVDVYFSPKFMDMDYNADILAAAKAVQQKTYADYLLRLTVTWTNTNANVDNKTPLSKITEVTVETVGINVSVKSWDEAIYAELLKYVEDMSANTTVKGNIERSIANNTSNEEMVLYIDGVITQAKSYMQNTVTSRLNAAIKSAAPVSKLDSQLIIVGKGIDQKQSVSGYKMSGYGWSPVDTSKFGDSNNAIYSAALGAFVFAGSAVSISGVSSLPNSGGILSLITKYGLEEYFGQSIDIEANATRLMIAGSVAKIAGAPKGADPFEWLQKNRSLTVSARNSAQAITSQEAVYLIMALYEMKTGTKIASIQIKNFTLTAGIAGLDDTYKKSVQAAFEMGIYTDKNMQPRSPMLVKDALQLLYALSTKVKL